MSDTQTGDASKAPPHSSGEDPDPVRPSFHQFARAVAARNSARTPGLVVTARAAVDMLLGQSGKPSETAEGSAPASAPSASRLEDRRAPRHPLPRSLRGARIVAGAAIGVAICVGTFGRAAAGFEVAASTAPVEAAITPLSVLRPLALRSVAGGGAATDSLAVSPPDLDSIGVRVSAGAMRGLSAPATSRAGRARTDAIRREIEALQRRPELPPGLPVGVPVAGPVSSPFGFRRHPVLGGRRHHDGTDFAVPLRTPVRVTADGRVVSAGRRSGYGLAVEVAHRDPAGLETRTLYAHLGSAVVRTGQPVRRGDVVALSGGVGPGAGLSTGPHLHYELRLGKAGGAADPATLLDRVRVWRAESARRAALVARRVRDSRATIARTDSTQ